MTRNSRLLLFLLSFTITVEAPAQTVPPASARAAAPHLDRATAAWTHRTKGDIRWQQITPAGTLLLSTDAALTGVETEHGSPGV